MKQRRNVSTSKRFGVKTLWHLKFGAKLCRRQNVPALKHWDLNVSELKRRRQKKSGPLTVINS